MRLSPYRRIFKQDRNAVVSLESLVAACQRVHLANADGLATVVEIRRGTGEVISLTAPLEITDRQEPDERGGLSIIEIARLFVPIGVFDPPLGIGDRLCVDNIEAAYTFAWSGSSTKFGVLVVFERQAGPKRASRTSRKVSETGRPIGGR
jgi:hypothetical protein